MADDVYRENKGIFIWRSIITIVSAAVSIGICTIHWIEYRQNNNIKRSCCSVSSIINQLRWTTIISFCCVCIFFAIFTIIDQVARVSNILCDEFSNRIISATVQFGVSCMHCLFFVELHSLYKETEFELNPLLLKICIFIVITGSVLSCILLLFYVDLEQYRVILWGTTHNFCDIKIPKFLQIIIAFNEIFVIIFISYLYISRLYKLIKLEISILNALKITILSIIASIITFATLMIIGLSDHSAWSTFIAMPLNCICLMLMTKYYPNGYRNICCLFVKSIEKCQRREKQKNDGILIYELENNMNNNPISDQPQIRSLQKGDN